MADEPRTVTRLSPGTSTYRSGNDHIVFTNIRVLDGSGDFSAIKMPSGRAALIERMHVMLGQARAATIKVLSPEEALVEDMSNRQHLDAKPHLVSRGVFGSLVGEKVVKTRDHDQGQNRK